MAIAEATTESPIAQRAEQGPLVAVSHEQAASDKLKDHASSSVQHFCCSMSRTQQPPCCELRILDESFSPLLSHDGNNSCDGVDAHLRPSDRSHRFLMEAKVKSMEQRYMGEMQAFKDAQRGHSGAH